ncbi:MAG: hypothetical protein Q9213_005773 [Squamulea squamosa]
MVRLLQDSAQLLQGAMKSSLQTELPHFMPSGEGGEYSETSHWTGPPYKHFNNYVLQYRGKSNIKENLVEDLHQTNPVVEVEAPTKEAKTPFRQNPSSRTQTVDSHNASVDHYAEVPASKKYPKNAYMMSRARPDEGKRPVYAPSDSSNDVVMDKHKHSKRNKLTPAHRDAKARNRKKKDRKLRYVRHSLLPQWVQTVLT